ncbi:MAG: S1-like domain-containing RNA-binding protein [Spirochaetales bacterium]|nr:S1-like domain-containing RNA-binding protein [Spirochaetales bacterium]
MKEDSYEDIMLKIAEYNELQILTVKINGCYLDGGSETVFLPSQEMPDGADQGDYIEVYIYRGRDGLLKATTEVAPAVMGGFGSFKVRKKQEYGAFLDWGLGRDLFLPKRFYRSDFEEGDQIVVKLIPDVEDNSVIATEKFSRELEENDTAELEENDEVDLLIWEINERGARVIVNDSYPGMVYANEIFEPLKRGDEKRGYVKKVREDGKIDAALQKQGFRGAVDDTREKILKVLKGRGGRVALGDKSSPEDIKATFQMSKKMFKKTVGVMYKEGIVKIGDNFVELTGK